MTPTEARKEFRALRSSVGLNADIYVSFGYGNEALMATIYPNGLCNNDLRFSVDADDWAQLVALAKAKWDEHKNRHRAQTIRKMALEIIRITAELGECTDAALRTKFNAGDIASYGKDACEDANNIAGKGPFKIKTMRGANSIGDEEEAA